jgi:predicted nucleotidyltransferase
MTTTSFNISGKLDAQLVEVMAQLSAACSSLGADFLLVGAVARDIHFLHVHGRAPVRATADVDFAVLVPSWEVYEQLLLLLMQDARHTRDEKRHHRLYSAHGVMLDVIPFGGLEGANSAISWPPHFDQVMSTVGYRDVLACAPIYRVSDSPPVDLRVASAAGIAVLKLIAWADAYPLRKRDAVDIRFMLTNYDAGNIDRLYSDEENLFSEEEAEYAPAVARLLGRDAGRLVSPDTTRVVLAVLDREVDMDGDLRLLGDMLAGSDERADVLLELLGHFRQGVIDSSAESTQLQISTGTADV